MAEQIKIKREGLTDVRGPISGTQAESIGLVGRIARFVLAGGTVAAMYLLVTLLLAKVVGLPFQVALAIGFATALATHFTLQRVFVWVHHEEFALPLAAQARRYLALSLTQYGITAAATAILPGLLGVSTEVVYLLVTAFITTINFLLFRTRIFHPASAVAPAGPGGDCDAPISTFASRETHPAHSVHRH